MLQQAELSKARSGWFTRDVVHILIAQMVFGFAWSLYLLLPKFYATALHVGPESIGRITAVGGGAGLLTVPITALTIDRFGRRRFFQVGSVLVVLMSLGFMRVHSVGCAVYLLQGCVSASFVLAFNASAAAVSDYAPPQKLGQAIGWVGSMNVAMNAISTLLAEPLAAAYGWNCVFALGAGAGAAALLLSGWLREAPVRSSPTTVAAESDGPFQRHSELCALILAGILMGGVFVATFSFVQPYAVSLGAQQVRGFFVGFTISAGAGRVLLGGLGDRFGRRPVSFWALLGYGLSAFSLRHLSPDLLLWYGLLFGAAHGILYPTLNALLISVLPADRRGLGMVLYNGAFNLGSSVGSLGAGLVAKHYGYPALYSAATGTAGVAAVILALFGRHRLR